MSKYNDPNETVSKLADFVNGLSQEDVDIFVQQLVYGTHRTLQQLIMKLNSRVILEYAKLNENQYDMRNEYTVQLCKKIVAAVGDDLKYFPYL